MPFGSLCSSIAELLVTKLEALLVECNLIDSNEHTLDNMEYFFLDIGRNSSKKWFDRGDV